MRFRLREAVIDGLLLGLFMLSACAFTTLLEHPSSPAHAALPDPNVRRAFIGLAMGATAIALVHSPWGRRSGAHLNPGVTLAFLRLGRVAPADAAGYVAAQFAGGALGVLLSRLVLGGALAEPHVNYAATVPGPAGAAVAFAAEFAMTFGLLTLVLNANASPRAARWTGVLAGATVALYIALFAPLSGMSLNPARTFASASVGGVWTGFWLYCVAPPLGMQAAAELYLRTSARPRRGCAKLHHDAGPCHFCDWQHRGDAAAPAAAPRPAAERT